MTIRAKFRVTSVEHFEHKQERVKMIAVSGKDGSANAQWSKFTPSGDLGMTISNPDAQGKLEVGKEYFLDISEATAEG